MNVVIDSVTGFESFVNSEEYQTTRKGINKRKVFESFVNSEEYQTIVDII